MGRRISTGWTVLTIDPDKVVCDSGYMLDTTVDRACQDGSLTNADTICRVNPCNSYCLNDGACNLQGLDPVCNCPALYQGDTCDDDSFENYL